MINEKFRLFSFVFRYGMMTFVAFISLGPLVWVIFSSFQSNAEILDPTILFPTSWSINGYRTAIELARLPQKFLTSFIVGGTTTVISILFYSMAAYVLARTRFRFKGVIFTVLISSILIPVNTMVQPVFQMIRFFNLYDTRTALIFVYIGFSLPISLFLLRSFMLNLPYELEESAYLEGATFPVVFFRIVLPLTKPALTSAAILTFLASWHELLYALLLTSSERNRTLPLAMRYFVQSFTFDYSAMFASLVLYIIPSVVIYVILQDSIMQGMVAGAVKE